MVLSKRSGKDTKKTVYLPDFFKMAKKTYNILIVILLAFAVDVCAADFRCEVDTVVPTTAAKVDTARPAAKKPAKAPAKKPAKPAAKKPVKKTVKKPAAAKKEEKPVG